MEINGKKKKRKKNEREERFNGEERRGLHREKE